MPSKQHERWKRDLFKHLERKLSGCIECEFGENQDSHAPTHRGRHREPSQEILWTCERMHPHAYDVLRGAGFVVMEKYQSAPVSGRCCPDLTILNTHREPMAFIEIVQSNRPQKAVRVAEELGIPLFTILAPYRRSLRPGLQPSRPRWDLDPDLSEDAKRQMSFMDQVADELMRRNGDGDSTWANLDMMLDEDGNLGYASFRGSPPDLSGPAFPRTGNLIVAELCSWDCDKAMEMVKHQRVMEEQDAMVSMRQTLEQNLGRTILRAIEGAKEKTAKFVVPVGTEEVHVEMSLRPLNPHLSPNDPIALNLLSQLSDAAEKVRNSHKRDLLHRDADGTSSSDLISNDDENTT